MVEFAVLNLNNPKNRNRWIIGTPMDVPKSSPFYSEQIQIAYVNNPKREEFLKQQMEHYHTAPIEEFFVVLRGILKVKVEEEMVLLRSNQVLTIPPNKRHTIVDYYPPLEYFVIRAPISSKETKIVVKKS